MHYAHTKSDANGNPLPESEWEPLETHLQEVAKLAAEFAAAFGAADWAHLAGIWHDLGKYSDAFQQYLKAAGDGHAGETSGRVDHSTAGAQHAAAMHPLGMLLAYVIAGHHAGLPDWDDGQSESSLTQRLKRDVKAWRQNCPEVIVKKTIPAPPGIANPAPESGLHASFRLSLWLRMLFSALVDADFLATEAFMSPDRSRQRPIAAPSIAELGAKLEARLAELSETSQPSPVNDLRRQISLDCLRAADLEPGLFSLQVPTGGGKTLASMRFALAHANRHRLRRVICAIPFTSIIEQNAQVYRDVLGSAAVLEHHSNLDPEKESKETAWTRLAAENWDAPVVVTTNVQLFESLFACRTSRCRKLHRIARSVIVLDEAQAIPVELLKPTLMAMRELVDFYDCSIVLCTATQPALTRRDDFQIGLPDVREIIQNAEALHAALVRTKIESTGMLADDQLVARIIAEPQVLCIVNTRRHAATLHAEISSAGDAYHLSTRMCPEHRRQILEEVCDRLKQGLPCRVVSTQLIEAGVDVDFPVVYRAACGLDSLAQAAGRCNREGRLDMGRVYWFETEQAPPPGHLRATAQAARELATDQTDLLAPDSIRRFFEHYYWSRGERTWDKHRVLDDECLGNVERMRFQFRKLADRYKLIDNAGVEIVVPWGEGKRLVQELRRSQKPPNRHQRRRLQRYVVQVYERDAGILHEVGGLDELHGYRLLQREDLYDQATGLCLDDPSIVRRISDLMC